MKVYFQKSTFFMFLLDGPWLGSDGQSQSIGSLLWQSQRWTKSIHRKPLVAGQRWTKSIHRNLPVAESAMDKVNPSESSRGWAAMDKVNPSESYCCSFLCALHSFGESIYHKNKNPGLLSTSKDFICKLILFLGVVSPGIEPGTQGFSVLCSTN